MGRPAGKRAAGAKFVYPFGATIPLISFRKMGMLQSGSARMLKEVGPRLREMAPSAKHN